MTLVERFLKYVSFPTTSGEDREGKCSTDGQYVLAEELKKELSELGLTDISSNEYGIVYSTLKGEGNLTIAGTYGYLSFSKWRKYQATYN